MTPTPGNTDITASARQGVPLADNGSAVTGERAGRPVVALFVLDTAGVYRRRRGDALHQVP